jgi:hypothetical protein
MTEAEWLNSTDPGSMLEFLRDKTSDRKLRLYLCAGCRCISHLFYHAASAEAVEVAERFADGLASEKDLGVAAWGAEVPTFGYDLDGSWRTIYGGPTEEIRTLIAQGALPASVLEGVNAKVEPALRSRLGAAAELAYEVVHCRVECDKHFLYWISHVEWPGPALVHCVFGNPFRPVSVHPAWRARTVVALAQSIYDEKAFDKLPVLADALEEAGCTDAEILGHCRGPGPHVRGCWVVDLVIGKE